MALSFIGDGGSVPWVMSPIISLMDAIFLLIVHHTVAIAQNARGLIMINYGTAVVLACVASPSSMVITS